jgi:DNA-directed RNA polymerase specialized sigma24 family protein
MDEMVTDAVGAGPTTLRYRDFDSFYRTCWSDVYRPLAVTLGDPDLAREAVDEAMIRAYRRWRSVRGYRNPAGWVYRVAFNWAVSHLRKIGHEAYGDAPVDHVGPDNAPAVDLYDALRRLDIKHRSVVVLRYLLDWPESEIAESLGIARGTVKSRLNRAMSKLRKELT